MSVDRGSPVRGTAREHRARPPILLVPLAAIVAAAGGLVVAAALALPAAAGSPPPAAPPASAEQGSALRGNPFRGRQLLSEKLCSQCHAVWGHGGLLGPDLAGAVAGKSWLDLVGDFWNHTPRMIDEMVGGGFDWPSLDEREMADLLSYLYYLRLFDAPGDADRGAEVYARLRCGTCHNLGGEGETEGPDLDPFSAFASPVMLAQAMWNAGPEMQPEQVGRGGDIPRFRRDEMADLQAFIRARGIREDATVRLLPLPDPELGRQVFEGKQCATCHPAGGGEGPDLGPAVLDLSVAEISGHLWNHSYAMQDRMREKGITFPRFEGSEMADLISYLYSLGFTSVEEGNAARGAALFRRRGCVGCHERGGTEAPDIQGTKVAEDPISLATAMWNHAPQMHELMGEQAVAWPKFDPGDMKDLVAFLRRGGSATPDEGR